MEFLNDDIEMIDKECATIRYMNVFKRNLLAVSEQPLLEQLLLQELTDHWQATTDDSNGSALLNSSSNVNDDKKQNTTHTTRNESKHNSSKTTTTSKTTTAEAAAQPPQLPTKAATKHQSKVSFQQTTEKKRKRRDVFAGVDRKYQFTWENRRFSKKFDPISHNTLTSFSIQNQ